MRLRVRVAVTALTLLVLTGVAPPCRASGPVNPSPPAPPTRLKTTANDDGWTTTGSSTAPGRGAPRPQPAGLRPGAVVVKYSTACFSGATHVVCQVDTCPMVTPGSHLVWRYHAVIGSNGRPGPWIGDGAVCLSGNAPGRPVPAFTLTEFRRLKLPPGKARIQPPSGHVLINIETNLYVQDPAPVTLTTTVIGLPVTVKATPARYEWDAGDGAVLRTADPGGAYPRMTTTHTYQTPGKYQVVLRTVYTGQYSVSGGPYLPIDGEVTIDSPPIPVDAYESRAHLVGG